MDKAIEDELDEVLDDNVSSDIAELVNNVKDTSDLYFLSLLILDKLEDDSKDKYKMLSELAYLLNGDSFINLIQYFGGQTITIPSRYEIQNSLRLISLYYYRDIQGYYWKEALVKAGLPNDKKTSLSYKVKMNSFRKLMNKVRLPREIASIKDDEEDKSDEN